MADASFWSNSAQPTVQRVVTQFGSITGTDVGTANTIMALTKPRFLLMAQSTLNADVSIVLGEDDFWRFPSGINAAFVLDLRSNMLAQMTGQVLGVYYNNSAPTSGYLQVTVLG